MNKGRATATYTVGYDVDDAELHITINVPSTVEFESYVQEQVNGSVALGRFVAQLGVEYASVPTKAAAKKAAQLAALMAHGKTEEEANDIYDTIMGV